MCARVCVCVFIADVKIFTPTYHVSFEIFVPLLVRKKRYSTAATFFQTLSVNCLQFCCINLGIIIFASFHENALERLKIRYLATLIATSSARRGALISISYLERNVTSISINPASNKGLRATRKGARSSSPSIHLTLSWIVNP